MRVSADSVTAAATAAAAPWNRYSAFELPSMIASHTRPAWYS